MSDKLCTLPSTMVDDDLQKRINSDSDFYSGTCNSSSSSQVRDLTASSSHCLNCCGSRKSRRKRDGEFAVNRTTVYSVAIAWISVALIGCAEAGPVGSIFLAASSVSSSSNLWERPCGDGHWHGQSNNSEKIFHVIDVYHQTRQILNTLSEKRNGENALHWMEEADWGHYLRNFHFPKIADQFTFTKAHRALQQYLAMFNMFASMASSNTQNRYRVELKETFATMQMESRTLLCLIESVINGTHRMPNGRSPKYRYFTKSLMDKKLKQLRDETNEQNFLLVAKVIFDKYNEFVQNVSETAENRSKKVKAGGIGKNKNGMKQKNNKKKSQKLGKSWNGGGGVRGLAEDGNVGWKQQKRPANRMRPPGKKLLSEEERRQKRRRNNNRKQQQNNRFSV